MTQIALAHRYRHMKYRIVEIQCPRNARSHSPNTHIDFNLGREILIDTIFITEVQIEKTSWSAVRDPECNKLFSRVNSVSLCYEHDRKRKQYNEGLSKTSKTFHRANRGSQYIHWPKCHSGPICTTEEFLAISYPQPPVSSRLLETTLQSEHRTTLI